MGWMRLLLLVSIALAFAPLAAGRRCEDYGQHCRDWAAADECTKNPKYMRQHCRKSCNACLPPVSLSRVLDDVDLDKDGSITMAELASHLKKIHLLEEGKDLTSEPPADDLEPDSEHLASLQEAFAEQDKNDDGLLEESELDVFTHFNGLEEEEINEMSEEDKEDDQAMMEMERIRMRLADADKDGKLNREEFVVFETNSFTHTDEIKAWEDHERERTASRELSKLDANGDKILDKQELLEVLENLGDITHPQHLFKDEM